MFSYNLLKEISLIFLSFLRRCLVLKSLSGVGAFCLLFFTFQYIERATTSSLIAFAVGFFSSTMVISSPSAFTSSWASSLSGQQSDLQSHLREAEVFIQANSPRSAPGSLVEDPSFSIILGTSGMAPPVMSAPSTVNGIALNMIPATNSGKSVDKLVGLGEANPTFGGLSASDFARRVTGGEITK